MDTERIVSKQTREHYFKVALDLRYAPKFLIKILKAKSEAEIIRILHEARNKSSC